MRYLPAIASIVAMLSAAPALAGQDKPITDREPDAVDVAKTPVTDLNIDKEKIPELLIAAQREPYSLRGLGTCRGLLGAIGDLDALLGPDIDLPQAERDRITAGKAGKVVVGSLIPFRGIIREVSGANEHEKKVRAAIQAGLARRGFLKGIGLSRGCRYPARPASRELIAQRLAEIKAAEDAKKEKKEKKDN